MPEPKPYDPLDYRNLTVNLVRELMRQPALDLPLAERFAGPGVYALFYDGDYEAYGPLRSPDATEPIYVGKADPPRPKSGQLPDDSKPKLYERIRQHTRSLRHAENLRLAHFKSRYLVVVPLWIKMAEQFLVLKQASRARGASFGCASWHKANLEAAQRTMSQVSRDEMAC